MCLPFNHCDMKMIMFTTAFILFFIFYSELVWDRPRDADGTLDSIHLTSP